jgi:hypothetical protein
MTGREPVTRERDGRVRRARARSVGLPCVASTWSIGRARSGRNLLAICSGVMSFSLGKISRPWPKSTSAFADDDRTAVLDPQDDVVVLPSRERLHADGQPIPAAYRCASPATG